MLLDFPKLDGVGGVFTAELKQSPVFGGVEHAGGLVEILGEDDGVVDVVDEVGAVLSHDGNLSAVCWLIRCRSFVEVLPSTL